MSVQTGRPQGPAAAPEAVSNGERIFTPNPAWEAQRTAIGLVNDLMGGTMAMRARGERYLPRKGSEGREDYDARLRMAYLDNFYQKTVVFYLGQVFKRELMYDVSQDVDQARLPFKLDWFERFQEDVDRAGSNLNVFSKGVFQAGLVDGVTFIAVDYSPVVVRVNPASGVLEYLDGDEWRIKSKAADDELGVRPYLIHVKASQVLDAWAGAENGVFTLKHFRYLELIETAKTPDGLEREVVEQVIAWWPDRWEKWHRGADGVHMVATGPNALGKVPVAWFRPGEPRVGLTARPPLDDLAELNRVYWAATSEHDGRLMPYVRSPAFFAVNVEPPKGLAALPLSPGQLISASSTTSSAPAPSLTSVGVDNASAVNSQADLGEKREAMRDYGLQTVQTGVTATMSENVATNASSSLKGWCVNFKDSVENVLRLVAKYQGWEDGPAVKVNMEFKNALDLNLLAHLYQATQAKVINPEYYVSQLLSMMPFSDDWTVKTVYNEKFGQEDYRLPGFEGEYEDDTSKKSTKGGDEGEGSEPAPPGGARA